MLNLAIKADHYVDFLSPLIIWTNTETWIILIVGCVPPIRPLFIRVFHSVAPKLATSRDRSYARTQFSRQGTHIPSDKSFDLPDIPTQGRLNNQVYLGERGGAYEGGTHATAGRRDNRDRKSWVDIREDRIVMTTKIDVDYDQRNESNRTFFRDRDEV